MKLAHFLFGVLLCFLVVIIAIWVTPEPQGITGIQHPTYSSMFKSGATMEGNSTIQWLSYLFGALTLSVFGSILLFGAKRHGKWGKAKTWMLGIMVLYFVTYTMMYLSYLGYLSAKNTTFFLSFPAPSAWMMYGMTLVPFLFILVYVLKFDEWVLSKEDNTKFKALVANNESYHINEHLIKNN